MGKFKWLQEEITGQPVLFFSCMSKPNNSNAHLPSKQHFNTQEGLISQAMGVS